MTGEHNKGVTDLSAKIIAKETAYDLQILEVKAELGSNIISCV